jgi:protein TonB
MNNRLVNVPRMAYYYGSHAIHRVGSSLDCGAADPEYTPEALAAKLRGTVKVARGLGNGLDEKAVECLQKWRFKPGMRNGEPVPVKATIEVNFRLPPV